MHHAFRSKLIWLTFVVGISRAEGEDETLEQFNTLMGQILDGAYTRQAQSVEIIQVLEVGVNPARVHQLARIRFHVLSALGLIDTLPSPEYHLGIVLSCGSLIFGRQP